MNFDVLDWGGSAGPQRETRQTRASRLGGRSRAIAKVERAAIRQQREQLERAEIEAIRRRHAEWLQAQSKPGSPPNYHYAEAVRQADHYLAPQLRDARAFARIDNSSRR